MAGVWQAASRFVLIYLPSAEVAGLKHIKSMKKCFFFIAFIAIIVSFVSCGFTKKEKTDWNRGDLNLKGKVQELHIKRYSAKEAFGSWQKQELQLSTNIQFSEEGKILQIDQYNYDESADANTSASMLQDANSNYLHDKEMYIYSDNTKTINRYSNDEFLFKSITKYTDFGEIKSITQYNYDGEETYREEWSYNDKNQVIEKRFYREKELSTVRTNYEYDAQGLITKNIDYNAEGELRCVHRFAYDKEGRDTNEQEFDRFGELIESCNYSYNEQGLMSSFIHIYSGIHSTTEYEYFYECDEKGRRMDKKGNYTTKIIKYDSENVFIEERTIIYY